MARTKRVVAAAAAGIVAVTSLAACGGDDKKDKGSAGGGKAIVLGTTDGKIASLDPAGAYDMPSWTIFWNTFQSLLKVEPNGTTPVPDAAQKCDFSDVKTFTCTLKEGLKFSDGSPLTSADVKFSIDRVLKINDPNGPVSLLESLDTVEAPDPKTVTFKLKTEDATFPFKLTTGVGSIVSSKFYPADKLIENGKLLGSGPYSLDKFVVKQQASLKPNANYAGDAKLANGGVLIQYYEQAAQLKQAIEDGTVQVALKGLSPTDVADLRTKTAKGVQVVDGQGTEIRYLTFDVKNTPADNKAVRQAVAQVIDREAIAKQVYNDTVTPMYSMIPAGVGAHSDSFKQKYGAPSKEKAQGILTAAGVTGPVALTLWYTPSHYGPATVDEFTEIKRQLEASGLFKVELKTTEWEEYQKAFKAGQYASYGVGWFPDFPDADNFTAPFLFKGGYFKNHYENPALDELITKTQGLTDRKAAESSFAEIQKITAEDVPVLPVWQGKQIGAVQKGITGLDKTLDPTYIIRLWMIGTGGK